MDLRESVYDQSFYGRHQEGMLSSAQAVLGHVFKQFVPASVIDIGCGQGAWLATAEALGVKVLAGIDGPWVRRDKLLSNNIDFRACDFDEALPRLERKYDLAISLEVAEHIAPSLAASFVNTLCSAADVVLFGAAVKYQGGDNHVNEQWQSYWVNLFLGSGFDCVDCIRPQLWHDGSVTWWYRQNTFLFVNGRNAPLTVTSLRALEFPIIDVVHPEQLEAKVQAFEKLLAEPSLRFLAGCALRYLRSRAQWGTGTVGR